jgi:hypothetical protein
MEPYRPGHVTHPNPSSPTGQRPLGTVNTVDNNINTVTGSPSRESPSHPSPKRSDPNAYDTQIETVVDGNRRAILGFTWPGIEDGEPPSPLYSFFEYVDSVRNGTLEDFNVIQEQTKEWWSPNLDRGAGALIHFAVDHGRLDMVRHLLKDLRVPVNHQSLNGHWTPLHRCARMIHYKHAPYFAIFELLLAQGADPDLETEDGFVSRDLVVQKGYQWEEGEVRERVDTLVAEYSGVPKAAPWFYTGKSVGEVADSVISAWRSLPSIYAPLETKGAGATTGDGRAGAVGSKAADRFAPSAATRLSSSGEIQSEL